MSGLLRNIRNQRIVMCTDVKECHIKSLLSLAAHALRKQGPVVGGGSDSGLKPEAEVARDARTILSWWLNASNGADMTRSEVRADSRQK